MKRIFALLAIMIMVFAMSSAFANDGKMLYTKACGGCHGLDGSKATGGSTPVKGQTSQELFDKLQGYASGTFGGKQQKLMVNIVKKYSEEEWKLLADYMSTL